MEPFRGAPSLCARCGAINPDTFAPNGERVCRGCAGTLEANARLSVGKGTTKVGAAIGIAVGVFLILCGGLVMFAWEMSRLTARFVGLLVGLGIVAIVVSVRNLKALQGR
ncbi:MAG: hypothetical protein U0174_25640 [Polyangiaceae bacterium]